MLTPNMFGTEFSPIKHDRFGSLCCGQMRHGQLGHNSGWYNHLGEKIGWGDLDVPDVQALMKGLEPGEMFVTLSEQDSHWNFVTFSRDALSIKGQVAEEAAAPGFEYVCSKACYIVTKGACYVVDRHGYHHAAFKRGEEGHRLEGKHLIQSRIGLDTIVLNAESAKELLRFPVGSYVVVNQTRQIGVVTSVSLMTANGHLVKVHGMGAVPSTECRPATKEEVDAFLLSRK